MAMGVHPAPRRRACVSLVLLRVASADQLSILSDRKQLRSRIKDLPFAASIASAAPAGSAGISLSDPGGNRNRRGPGNLRARLAVSPSRGPKTTF
jgi:hypothetical protein